MADNNAAETWLAYMERITSKPSPVLRGLFGVSDPEVTRVIYDGRVMSADAFMVRRMEESMRADMEGA